MPTFATTVSMADPELLPTEDDRLTVLCREKLFLSAYLFIFLAIRALCVFSSFLISEAPLNEDNRLSVRCKTNANFLFLIPVVAVFLLTKRSRTPRLGKSVILIGAHI